MRYGVLILLLFIPFPALAQNVAPVQTAVGIVAGLDP